MKYSIVFKFLAILLCAACLLVSVAAGIGIFALVESDLYNSTVQELKLASLDRTVSTVARLVAKRYLIETTHSLPLEIIDRYLEGYYEKYGFFEETKGWNYTIADEKGNVIASDVNPESIQDALIYTHVADGMTYPVVLDYLFINPYTIEDSMEESIPPESIIDNTLQESESGSRYLYIENWGYEDRAGFHQYQLGICEAPVYTVTLYLMPDTNFLEEGWMWEIVELGYTHRYNIIWVLGTSLLLFAALFTYLCCAAGRKPKREEVCPGGLNRLPLDLYGAVTAGAVVMAVALCNVLYWDLEYFEPKWLMVLGVCAGVYLACLLIVGFLFSCAAQFKMRKFYWFKHCVVGFALILCWKLLKTIFGWLAKTVKWMFGKRTGVRKIIVFVKTVAIALWKFIMDTIRWVWKFLLNTVKWIWNLLKSIVRKTWYMLSRFFQLLPLTWQWLLVGFVMIFVLLLGLESHYMGALLLSFCICLCLVVYGAHCFGTLLEATKRMSKGELNTKVEDKLLLGGFKEYAKDLNALADVAVEAAHKQMKSERMKAELVTNVSHDIKTPLTSIINYVDLLQKAESQEQAEEYLEVLNRQSQRLKKLIEDLMEMSKASTGNMSVELTRLDAVETINQALGEFSEKLEKAQLVPVFNPPAEPVTMTADGRLTWRVLSNLLSNAVKYAMPGTRLYIDLVKMNDQVMISLKNISAEQLNVNSEELMERFVRGDSSRNTEGSGLGLNIAKSLMELQKGQLQLLVDGDLFKVTLFFEAE